MDLEEKSQKLRQHQRTQINLNHIQFNYQISSVKKLSYRENNILIGRENGLVELMRDRSFHSIGTYFGVQSPVSGLSWINDQEFIVSYLSGAICAFNYNFAYPKFMLQLNSEIAIFDQVVLDDWNLIIACSDSVLRIIEINEKLKLNIVSQSQNYQDQQCLSVDVWQNIIFASYSSGIVRQYQYKQPQQLIMINLIQLQPSVAKSKIQIPWVVKVNEQYLWVGTSGGTLQIFERKFYTEVLKLQTHQASILTGLIYGNYVYFSGTDSKIVCINCHTLKICGQARGQSHDVYALEMIGDRLISSGVNTDLCFYNLQKDGSIIEQTSYFRVQAVPSGKLLNLESYGKNKNHKSLILTINERNKIILSSMNDIFTQTQFIQLAEIQTNDLINIVRINQKCNRLMYSHSNKSSLLKIIWQNDTFQELQKVTDFEPAIQAEFYDGNLLYINNQNQLFILQFGSFEKKFIVQINLNSISYMKYIEEINQLVLISIIDQKLINLNLKKDYEQTETNLQLTDHEICDVSLLQGQNQVIIFKLYIQQKYRQQIIRMENDPTLKKILISTSKAASLIETSIFYLKHFFIPIKQIKGAICDGKDEKRMILYSDRMLIKAHQRGVPLENMKRIENLNDNDNNELIFDPNFTFFETNSQQVRIFVTKILDKEKIPQALVFEWDKEASFQNLSMAFNAKKYKQ